MSIRRRTKRLASDQNLERSVPTAHWHSDRRRETDLSLKNNKKKYIFFQFSEEESDTFRL